MLKDLVANCLASAGRAHKHDTETDIECLEQLYSLKNENLVSLKLENVNGLLNLGQELTIVGVGNFDSWEQVLDDGREEGQIILQELGNV
jgi:ferritin-like metal-binding protein YciE